MNRLEGQKLVFDVDGRPELCAAICARLKELGVSDLIYNQCHTKPKNVSVGCYGTDGSELCRGELSAHDNLWRNLRLTTLDDLYDLDRWLPKLQIEAGKRYVRKDGKVTGEMREWAVVRGECYFTDPKTDRRYDKDGTTCPEHVHARLVKEFTGHTITIDGKEIAVSEESYQALKESFSKDLVNL